MGVFLDLIDLILEVVSVKKFCREARKLFWKEILFFKGDPLNFADNQIIYYVS